MIEKKIRLYIRRGAVYIVPVAKTEAGFYVDVEPVSKVELVDGNSLANTLSALIEPRIKVVKTPPRDTRPVVLSHADCKTWSQFAKGCKEFSVELDGDKWHLIPYKARSDRGTEPDLENEVILNAQAPGSEVIQTVIKMIVEK